MAHQGSEYFSHFTGRIDGFESMHNGTLCPKVLVSECADYPSNDSIDIVTKSIVELRRIFVGHVVGHGFLEEKALELVRWHRLSRLEAEKGLENLVSNDIRETSTNTLRNRLLYDFAVTFEKFTPHMRHLVIDFGNDIRRGESQKVCLRAFFAIAVAEQARRESKEVCAPGLDRKRKLGGVRLEQKGE
jgi:hypothetical protein